MATSGSYEGRKKRDYCRVEDKKQFFLREAIPGIEPGSPEILRTEMLSKSGVITTTCGDVSLI